MLSKLMRTDQKEDTTRSKRRMHALVDHLVPIGLDLAFSDILKLFFSK